MRHQKRAGIGILVILLLVGGMVGDAVGQLLSPLWHPLGQALINIGAQGQRPWTLNLGVFGITLGVWFHFNLMGLVGLLTGLWWAQTRGN